MTLAGAIQTTDGWFGLALAVLNVFQAVALAFLAAWAARNSAGTRGKSGSSPRPPSGSGCTDNESPVTHTGEFGDTGTSSSPLKLVWPPPANPGTPGPESAGD